MLVRHGVKVALLLSTLIAGLSACGGGGGVAAPPQSAGPVVPKAEEKPEPVAAQRDCLLKNDAAACTVAAAFYDETAEAKTAAAKDVDGYNRGKAADRLIRSCLYNSPTGCEKAGDAVKDGIGGSTHGSIASHADLFYVKACELGNEPACTKAPGGAKAPPDPDFKALQKQIGSLRFFSDLDGWKGAVVQETPDKLFAWELPLPGFTTFVQQHNDGSRVIVARANQSAPLAPALDALLAQKLTSLVGGGVLMDSATDPSLRRRLGGPKHVKRIVVIVYSGSGLEGTGVLFTEFAEPVGSYEVVVSRTPH